MPHFFISTNDVNADRITICDKENFHHIARVLRAKIGETLSLIDENQTQYTVVVESIDSKSVTTKVVDSRKSNHILGLQLYLIQAVLKTDAQNFVVQKATELGVKGIIPFVGDNSVIKPSVVDTKIDKWQKIANEAVKQCERADFPIVSKRTTLKDFLTNKDFTVKIACVERDQSMTLKACLKSLKITPDTRVALLIGPEGGFSATELKLLNESDIYRVSLGELILRAETAVISALSNTIYELNTES